MFEPLERPTILMVDDQPENLLIQEEILEELNLRFITANSGAEALEKSLQYDYALALIDVQLPGMDGFELVRLMRKNKTTELLPVIFITALHSSEGFLIEGMETGAVDFISKPFHHRILTGKVKVFVDLYLQRKQLELEIRQRKAVEKEIRLAKEAAEQANRHKSEFLANMSHDIRTPMNAILGMADLLSETELNEEQKNYVNVCRVAGENLLNLINDILDLSKIERSQFKLEIADFNLESIIEKTCEVFSIKAFEKGVELLHHIHEDVPVLLRGDSVHLRQILVNLIGNAVKFTRQGEIVVDVSRHPKAVPQQGANDVELVFSIRDTGIGIKPEFHESIFQSFKQADSSTTREFGGTGLGLTISKRLVELLGGKITLNSQPDQGSTFGFNCRFEVQQGNVPEAASLLTNRTVLVIDDNRTHGELLGRKLKAMGATVQTVTDGREALAMFEKTGQIQAIPLILLDCFLKDSDGFALIRSLKTQSGVGMNNMIALLAPNEFGESVKKLKELQVTNYLVKPIKRSHLKLALNRALGSPVSTNELDSEATTAVEVTKTKPLNILLVDDSQDNRLLVEIYLSKTEHRVASAVNGQIAVAMFKDHAYHLVLMDMHMPVMDGYSATREIRRWEKQMGRPPAHIIALTANALKEDEQKSLDAGCNAYLTKPIKKQKLIDTINAYSRLSC